MDNNTIKVALDAIRGKVRGNYTSRETSDALRNAFIELNGGSTKIDVKNFHRGSGLFEVVEEIIPVIVDEGIREDDELMKLVEYRNVAYGDELDFVVRHKGYLAVRKVADGIMGVRRQRFDNGETLTIKTEARYVKVYEELGRLMTGRIDFNEFVDAVAEAFKRQIIADAYACLNSVSNATPGLSATYVRSGSFSEAELLELIDHVEAATGKKAKIIGTRSALRKVTTAVVSHEAETDMYNLGLKIA